MTPKPVFSFSVVVGISVHQLRPGPSAAVVLDLLPRLTLALYWLTDLCEHGVNALVFLLYLLLALHKHYKQRLVLFRTQIQHLIFVTAGRVTPMSQLMHVIPWCLCRWYDTTIKKIGAVVRTPANRRRGYICGQVLSERYSPDIRVRNWFVGYRACEPVNNECNIFNPLGRYGPPSVHRIPE